MDQRSILGNDDGRKLIENAWSKIEGKTMHRLYIALFCAAGKGQGNKGPLRTHLSQFYFKAYYESTNKPIVLFV